MYRSLSTADIPLHNCAPVKICSPAIWVRCVYMMSWVTMSSQQNIRSCLASATCNIWIKNENLFLFQISNSSPYSLKPCDFCGQIFANDFLLSNHIYAYHQNFSWKSTVSRQRCNVKIHRYYRQPVQWHKNKFLLSQWKLEWHTRLRSWPKVWHTQT